MNTVRLASDAIAVTITYHDRRRREVHLEARYLMNVDVSDGLLIVSGECPSGVDADRYMLVYTLEGVRDVLVASGRGNAN